MLSLLKEHFRARTSIAQDAKFTDRVLVIWRATG